MNEVIIDGIVYVPKTANEQAEKLDGLEYKIVRCDRSGVFAGYIEAENGQEVVIIRARRLWYWDGAASLSQLAEEGTSKPDTCKFPCEVSKIKVKDCIEIIDVTEKAKQSISEVPVWEN